MSDPNELMVWREVSRIVERLDVGLARTEFVECRWVPMWDRWGDGADLVYALPAEDRPPMTRGELGR